jgi:hypothetical protein
VAFDRPVYLLRAADTLLVAVSLAELHELLICACNAGHDIESMHAFHSVSATPTIRELRSISSALSRPRSRGPDDRAP